MTNKGNGYKFQAIMERRANKNECKLCVIKKNGKPGVPRAYEMYGTETVEDVIARLTKLNPGTVFVTAEEEN